VYSPDAEIVPALADHWTASPLPVAAENCRVWAGPSVAEPGLTTTPGVATSPKMTMSPGR
jgi:hypothetical protein